MAENGYLHRVLADQSFPITRRLRTGADFKHVFEAPDRRIRQGPFLALVRYDQGNRPRLGIVIGKKKIPLAHQRNRIKRRVRESFRSYAWSSVPWSIVILVGTGAQHIDHARLRAYLQSIWQKLQQTGFDTRPGQEPGRVR